MPFTCGVLVYVLAPGQTSIGTGEETYVTEGQPTITTECGKPRYLARRWRSSILVAIV